MRKVLTVSLLTVLALVTWGIGPALAQGPDQPEGNGPGVAFYAKYPSQEVAIGETVTFDLTLRVEETAQEFRLEARDLPEGWTPTFRGGGKVIRAVHVEPGRDTTLDLRLDLPDDVQPGTYAFSVVARNEQGEVAVPLEVIIKEKLPPRLTLEVELPMLRGTPNTTFRYNMTLKNEGDEEISVNLIANPPAGFQVSFKLMGQDVTSVPLGANETKRVNVEARAYTELPAGQYPIDVLVQGGEAQASATLIAEITGQPDLRITGIDGRLSGQAYAGRETSFDIIVRNEGTAPARGVELSATPPSDWEVEFDPQQIAEIPAGEEAQVTVRLQPSEQAVAGDYIVTLRARPEDGSSESAEFRITVRTSTLWGVVGIVLIAIAVFVVALAVTRFGRR